jgi:drug/metabolite transporter (DMT)-like permease
MISWILIAIIAYILFAVTGVLDKFLISHVEQHPIVYAFFSGIVGPATFILAPFGLIMLNARDMTIAVVAGVLFTIGMYYMYSAVRMTSISRVLPIEGGLVPVFTLAIAYFFLGERLTVVQNFSFVFLVVGAVLVSFRREQTGWRAKALGHVMISAFLFALSLTMTKYIYNQSNLVSGLIWTRLGFFASALAILLSPKARRYIFHARKKATKRNLGVYLTARGGNALAGFLQNYAISLGSVSIVNALQGVQFVFLLLLTTGLSVSFPKVLKERVTTEALSIKLTAIVLISIGLFLLAK